MGGSGMTRETISVMGMMMAPWEVRPLYHGSCHGLAHYMLHRMQDAGCMLAGMACHAWILPQRAHEHTSVSLHSKAVWRPSVLQLSGGRELKLVWACQQESAAARAQATPASLASACS